MNEKTMVAIKKIEEEEIKRIVEETKKYNFLYLDEEKENEEYENFLNSLEENGIDSEEIRENFDEPDSEFSLLSFSQKIEDAVSETGEFFVISDVTKESNYAFYVKEKIAKENFYNPRLLLDWLGMEDNYSKNYFISDTYDLCLGLIKKYIPDDCDCLDNEYFDNLMQKYDDSFDDNNFHYIYYDYDKESIVKIKENLTFDEAKEYLKKGYNNEDVVASEKIAKRFIQNNKEKEKTKKEKDIRR